MKETKARSMGPAGPIIEQLPYSVIVVDMDPVDLLARSGKTLASFPFGDECEHKTREAATRAAMTWTSELSV